MDQKTRIRYNCPHEAKYSDAHTVDEVKIRELYGIENGVKSRGYDLPLVFTQNMERGCMKT
ncbi:hypothetical protein FOPG_09626 [Fusarium oxysporum f. sp. conglutinans race 2 54008]|uniref:Uncharacterized protein n=1 Tax=Fusarium oxysporum f. sp. conglutinans race 2 54008 TaxID=1089457 RepID=X0HUY2_FUSOX|nr:hypothetical protein FOPG_09626 [Fusarium oxysporum f. sp. conglutinans race 2 54008]